MTGPKVLPCVAALLVTALPIAAAATESVVFQSGDDGYHTYRIPAIVKAANGDLLAFAEGRKHGGGDHGDIDLVLKRSADDGATWSDMQIVQDEWDDPAAKITLGNPAPVVDKTDPAHPGRVWLPFTRDNKAVFVTFSDDHGATWSPRRDVSSTGMHPDWGWYATGPGHALQLTRGPYAGRLIVASDHSLRGKKSWGAHVLLSDDHGATWRVGATDTRAADAAIHPNENMAEELVDGRIYFHARDQHGSDPATRAVAHSSDGGETYDTPFAPAPEFVTPVVQNSILRIAAVDRDDDENLLAWCGPGQADARADLTVRFSRDEGATWSEPVLIAKGPAAYSDLVLLDGPALGVLYEGGPTPYSQIVFRAWACDKLSE